MRMKKGILSLTLLAALLAVLLIPFSVAAEGPQPVFPTVFYGKITVNGAPAPEGTVITGMMKENEEMVARGDITVTRPGKYGEPEKSDILVINTLYPFDIGKTIWFYVQLPNWKKAIPANETAVFDSDENDIKEHELNLTVTGNGGIIDDGGSSGGGGGGAGGTKTETSSSNILVTADVFGTEVRFYITPAGAIVNTVTLKSPDNQMSITLLAGTLARTASGQPISSLAWSKADNPPQPPSGTAIIGSAFNLENTGTTFNPPATFTYNYDPAALPSGINEADLTLAFYNPDIKEWVKLTGTVDTAARTLTVPISHFTTFAITGLLPVVLESAPKGTSPAEAAPAVTAPDAAGTIAENTPAAPADEEQLAEVTSPFNWALIGGIIGAVVIAFLAIMLVKRRRTV